MKKKERILEILNNKELLNLDNDSKELWLRANIVMQFVILREKKGLFKADVARKMNVTRQMIAKFESMTHSPTIAFLVKYASALDTKIEVLLRGIYLIEVSNE